MEINKLFEEDLYTYPLTDLIRLREQYRIPSSDPHWMRTIAHIHTELLRNGELTHTPLKIQDSAENFNFNPSIVAYLGDYYLISYRSFTRNIPQFPHDPDLFQQNLNHPRFNSPPKYMAWKGKDRTKFAFFRIHHTQVQFISHLVTDGGIFELDAADLRMLRIPSEEGKIRILLTFNQHVKSSLEISQGRTCEGGCMLIGSRELVLDEKAIGANDDIQTLTFNRRELSYVPFSISPEKWLCLDRSNPIEKNWSFWRDQKQTFFSYSIESSHTIYLLDTCRVNKIGSSPFQYLSDAYFNPFPVHSPLESVMAFSCSTPAKRFTADRLLSVGHCKINFKYLESMQLSPLKGYLLQLLSRPNIEATLHHLYCYLSFFYSFDPATGNIDRVSHLFTFPTKTGIMFPSGLEAFTEDPEKYLVTYGIGDDRCEVMVISKAEIEELWVFEVSPETLQVYELADTLSFKRPRDEPEDLDVFAKKLQQELEENGILR